MKVSDSFAGSGVQASFLASFQICDITAENCNDTGIPAHGNIALQKFNINYRENIKFTALLKVRV